MFLFSLILKKGYDGHRSDSERIFSPSNRSVGHPVAQVSHEVKDKLKDLKEVAKRDAKPERETTTQGIEQASILPHRQLKDKSLIKLYYLDAVINLVLHCFFVQRCVVDIDLGQILRYTLSINSKRGCCSVLENLRQKRLAITLYFLLGQVTEDTEAG